MNYVLFNYVFVTATPVYAFSRRPMFEFSKRAMASFQSSVENRVIYDPTGKT